MPKTIHHIIALALCLPVILVFRLSICAQDAQPCPKTPNKYAEEGFTTKAIEIHTARDPFGSINKKVAGILKDSRFKLKEKEAFDNTAYKESFDFIKGSFPPSELSQQRVRVYAFAAKLKDCNEQTKTLEAHFYVYTSDYLQYLSAIFEADESELGRAVTPTKLTRFLSKTSPQPYVSFNRARGIYGGSRFNVKLDNPVVREIQLNGSGSSSSAVAEMRLQGSRDFSTKALSYAEWLAGYRFTNIPSVANDLKEGKGYAQWIGATAPLGKLDFVVRYGAAVEGGNSQSQLEASAAPAGVLPSAGYGSLKTFIGGTFRKVNQEFTASYGLELGKVSDGPRIDYIKHIFDLGYSIRFLPRDHKPIKIDTRLTAGTLNQRGNVPVGVRFFGGNAENNFINSDDWIIQSTPLIRSFPQNRFIPAGQTVATGGERFVSFNFTLTPTVWGRPLVPTEVSEDQGFKDAVCLEFDSAENNLYLTNLSESEPVKTLAGELLKLNETSAVLDKLDVQLESLKVKFEGHPEHSVALTRVKATITRVRRMRPGLEDLKKEVGNRLSINSLTGLLLDTRNSSGVIILPSRLNDLGIRLDELVVLPEASQSDFSAEFNAILEQKRTIDALRRGKPCLFTCMLSDPEPYACIDNKSQACDPECLAEMDGATRQSILNLGVRARQAAKGEIAPARALFGRLTDELNLVAISPIFMFDAARIGPESTPLRSNTTRYGLGGGVQFTFISLDLGLGYSFNPRRREGEPRGAFVLSLSVSDLLR